MNKSLPDSSIINVHYDYLDCSKREYVICSNDGVWLMRYRKQPNKKYSSEIIVWVEHNG